MSAFVRLAVIPVVAALMCAHSAIAATSPIARDRIEPARDLRQDARDAAAAGIPLVVMVSLAGCPHCDTIRRAHLLPLLKPSPSPATKPAQLIRQIELNGGESLIDFNGEATTHAEFARRNKVTIAPVVLFYGAEGERIADPLVGAMIADFYGSYFDAALAEAKAKARAPNHRAP